MEKKQLNLTNHRIWKDKNIKPEGKEIYAYIYSKGFDRLLTHINIGEIQQIIPITNIGFRNNLRLLEKFKYLIYKEFDTGMYEIHIK